MRYNFQKSVRIVTDLITHLHQLGSRDYHVDIKLRKGVAVYMLSAPLPNLDPEKVEELNRTLNMPRQREVEQNYWGLTGEVETDTELMLVGMMVDDARVEYSDGTLTIVARRVDETLQGAE